MRTTGAHVMTLDTMVRIQTEAAAPATMNGSDLTNVVMNTTMTEMATVMVVDGPRGSEIGARANMGGTVTIGPTNVVDAATGRVGTTAMTTAEAIVDVVPAHGAVHITPTCDRYDSSKVRRRPWPSNGTKESMGTSTPDQMIWQQRTSTSSASQRPPRSR